VASLLEKPAESNHGESQTHDTLFSKNRHFPLDQVQFSANVMNSALSVAQSRICFFSP